MKWKLSTDLGISIKVVDFLLLFLSLEMRFCRKNSVGIYIEKPFQLAYPDSSVFFTSRSRRQFPFMVNVNLTTGGFCGGVLVQPDVVVTAAHCVYNETTMSHVDIDDIKIHAGQDVITLSDSDLGVLRNVVDVIFYISYFQNKSCIDHDIAILKLESPYGISESIGLIDLPDEDLASLPENSSCTIIGWGLTENGVLSMNLRHVDIPILESLDCSKIRHYSNTGFNSGRQFCAGVRGRDACPGDSGGPCVLSLGNGRQVLYGIISHGGKNCGEEPGVYTLVPFYTSWIRNPSSIWAFLNMKNAAMLIFVVFVLIGSGYGLFRSWLRQVSKNVTDDDEVGQKLNDSNLSNIGDHHYNDVCDDSNCNQNQNQLMQDLLGVEIVPCQLPPQPKPKQR